MNNKKQLKKVLFAFVIIVLVASLIPIGADSAKASVSDTYYNYLKGTWATGSSSSTGYGPRNYVKFTKDKVNYYYRKKKGGKLIFDFSAELVSAEKVGNSMIRYKVEGEWGNYYYEISAGRQDYLDYRWYEDGEWYYSGGSSLTKVYSTPAKVKGVVASKIGKRSVALKWKKAKNAKYYQIFKATKTYKSGGKTKYKYEKIASTKNCKYKIRGLSSGKAYRFKVRAINGSKQIKKKGKMSKSKRVRTK